MKNEALDKWNAEQFSSLWKIEDQLRQLKTFRASNSLRRDLIHLNFEKSNQFDSKVMELFRAHRAIYQSIILKNKYVTLLVSRRISKDIGQKTWFEDIRSLSFIGLIYAVEHFDHHKNNCFGAFAYIVTTQRVWDEIKRPGNLLDKRFTINSQKIDQAIVDVSTINDAQIIDTKRILELLPDNERKVIALRFGLDAHYDEQSTLIETAISLGISHETVRRCEIKGLKRLRQLLSA